MAKKSHIYIDGEELQTNSEFFRTFADVVKKSGTTISFLPEKPDFRSATYWGAEQMTWNFIQSWEAIHPSHRRIELTDMFGIFEQDSPQERTIKGQILTMSELVTHVQHISLFNKKTYVASVSRVDSPRGPTIEVEKGAGYRREFAGLEPEVGHVKDPRPWLEKIVRAYAGE